MVPVPGKIWLYKSPRSQFVVSTTKKPGQIVVSLPGAMLVTCARSIHEKTESNGEGCARVRKCEDGQTSETVGESQCIRVHASTS